MAITVMWTAPTAVWLLVALAGTAEGVQTRRFICWFRSDLRLHDNPLLKEAAAFEGPKEVLPVYIFDPRTFGESEWHSQRTGAIRAKFLIESVAALRKALRDIGSDLLVGIGEPEALLPLLAEAGVEAEEAAPAGWPDNFGELNFVGTIKPPEDSSAPHITLSYQAQVTPLEAQVSRAVKGAMPATVSVRPVWSGTLFDRVNLPFARDLSDMPDNFFDYRKALGYDAKEGIVDIRSIQHLFEIESRLPVPAEGALPLPPAATLEAFAAHGVDRTTMPQVAGTPPAWRRTTWRGATIYTGGEASGLKRLKGYDAECLADRTAPPQGPEDIRLATFAPWLLEQEKVLSTKLSPWLANGCLSPRMVAHELNLEGNQGGQKESSLIFELMARDFYRFSCAKHGGNLFLPEGSAGKENSFYKLFLQQEGQNLAWVHGEPPWEEEAMLERWKAGETGVPLIDALMRELFTTGFISHRGRQNAASFFCLELGLDWRRGADHFASLLIDYDVCSNWGNWATAAGLSGGGQLSNFPLKDVHPTLQRQRVLKYDPVQQALAFDPDGSYTRYWVPELRAVPAPLVHQPWLLTAAEQEQYGVKLGKHPLQGDDTYPLPPKPMPSQPGEAEAAPQGRQRRRRGLGDALALGEVPPRYAVLGEAAPGASPPRDGSVAESPSFALLEEGSCALEITAAWFEHWRQRFEDWWLVTPYQDNLQACIGALGLHLAARFEQAVRLWQLGRRSGAAKPPPATSPAGGADCEMHLEQNAQRLQLPDFPAFPDQFRVPELPPVPRLLPSWQRLQSLRAPQGQQREHRAQAFGSESPSASAPSSSAPGVATGAAPRALAVGALGGVSLGVLALLPLWARRRRQLRRAHNGCHAATNGVVRGRWADDC